ncbi:crustacyanin-A1 subunit-like [Penaeus monodon]|uniref:crustacyanin-A1 subunit-like n=1 Tax=Penaeus monodon TaxID=6687 RepID=UPI0018A78143|nr:crustacyanin-A1 subunit-like [Penaeus monodon]
MLDCSPRQVPRNTPRTSHLSSFTLPSCIAAYVIMNTDYENFLCIYSCSGYHFGYYSDFAFISRSPSLADRYYRRCEAAFMNISVDPSRFTKTAQRTSYSHNTYRSW